MSHKQAIASLPQNQYELLQTSATNPAMFMTLVGYHRDKETDTIYYELQIGVQSGADVIVSDLDVRYSALQKLDRFVRPIYKSEPYLKQFPPKKYFGNMKEEFVKKRAEELTTYISNLPRIPGILSNPSFKETFDI